MREGAEPSAMCTSVLGWCEHYGDCASILRLCEYPDICVSRLGLAQSSHAELNRTNIRVSPLTLAFFIFCSQAIFVSALGPGIGNRQSLRDLRVGLMRVYLLPVGRA